MGKQAINKADVQALEGQACELFLQGHDHDHVLREMARRFPRMPGPAVRALVTLAQRHERNQG